MAFVLEDGVGRVDSNAYISLEFANEWLGQKGRINWAELTDPEKEQAIVRATLYIDARFDFVGYERSREQSLAWPRSSAYDQNNRQLLNVPREVQRACAEYSYQASMSELHLTPTIDESGRFVTERFEKVDVIEERVRFSDALGVRTFRPIPEADALLRYITQGQGGRGNRILRN